MTTQEAIQKKLQEMRAVFLDYTKTSKTQVTPQMLQLIAHPNSVKPPSQPNI